MKYSSFVLIAVSGIILTGCRGSNSSTSSSSSLDPKMVAACLKDKSAKMYGTERCPHCKEQKKLFGSAFSTIEYIDCDKEKVKCQLAGVQSIPTWIFSDGSRLQ
jgi:glutaredoxin